MSININTDVNAITFSTLFLPIIHLEKPSLRKGVQNSSFKNWSSQWYSYLRNVIDFCLVLGINIISNTSLPRSFIVSILFLFNQIIICMFSKNLENILFLLFFTHLFFKKAARNNRKRNNTTKGRISTIFLSMVLMKITLLMINVGFKDTCINEHQIHISLTKYRERFVEGTSFHKILIILDQPWVVHVNCESENLDQGRSYQNKTIDISDCFFSRSFSYFDNGGVIFVSGGTFSMNINSSMFYNCGCSQSGGAILFYSTNSTLKMTCANRCSASYYSHFAYLEASQTNLFEYLSISNCSHDTSGYHPIEFTHGNQRLDNTNFSMNKAYSGSGIDIDDPSLFKSSYCTFFNNNVSDSICIEFNSEIGIISKSFANIVRNNSPKYYGIVYVFVGISKMMYCIFKNNQNYLFFTNEGSLEVSHSFIDNSTLLFSSSIEISTKTNNSFMEIQTYFIEYYGSHICKYPFQTQDISKHPKMTWIMYSLCSCLIVILLFVSYIYRRIAMNFIARNHLEICLQNDFG